VFAGEPFPRATKARVDFIEDQQRPVSVAKIAQQSQETGRRNVDAPSCLNRFDNDRADFLPAEKF
jgi:hypothetical protein